MSTRASLYALIVLLICAVIVWSAVLQEDRRGLLTVSFLDVGQGDAIFIDTPHGRQVLIDGGAGSQVLRELSRAMPWYDRSIDMVIGTHGDMDHIGGLIDVLPRYRVHTIVVPSVVADTSAWSTYSDRIAIEEKSGAHTIVAERGQRYDIGGGAYLDVLFPDRPTPYIETNTGCIITRLVYGDTSFLLPCDAPSSVEKYLVALDRSTSLTADGSGLKSDVLKASHHGSKTSSNPLFVGTVDPLYVIYSRGCDNSYGHPHPDVMATYARFQIPALDTCTDGTITFVSDGQNVRRK